jgi:hypothetical protein
MSVVPAATPETMPEVPTVATEVLLLLHVPPEVASLSELVKPGHVVADPVIAAGAGLTVIVMTLEVAVVEVTQARLLVSVHETVLPVLSDPIE